MKNEFKQEYEQLLKKVEDEAEERRNKVYAAEPVLKQIAYERRDIVYHMGLAAVRSSEPLSVREKALSELRKLNERESAILTRLKLPADYFEPQYRCRQCKDTGFVGSTPKKPCSCYLQRLSAKDFASSSLNSGESFENFDVDVFKNPRQHSFMKNAKTICEKYADGLPVGAETQNLLLMGKPGLGKTYLVNCIALRALQHNVRVIKLTSYNFIDRVFKSIREGGSIEDIMNVRLLCIDDLGTEPMITNITREYIFSVLNERLNAGLNTVFATNLSYDTIQELYDQRFFSRLVSPKLCKVLLLEGEDIRLSPK